MRDDAFYVGETGRRIRWTCTTSSAAHTGKRARNTALWCICATGGATGQMQRLKRYGQLKAMQEQRWTEDDFRREFGKSYL